MAVRVIREEFNPTTGPSSSTTISSTPRCTTTCRPSRRPSPTGCSSTTRAMSGLPLFERSTCTEQLQKALDRKVWLPSGGSLIIEHTEALTVIDVNTGKNVGSSSLEETVFRNNLEAAESRSPAAAAARHRRHHRDRLHRHGDQGENRDDWSSRCSARRWPATRPARRCSTSPSSGAGRDDPQAHRRGAARVVLDQCEPLRRPWCRARPGAHRCRLTCRDGVPLVCALTRADLVALATRMYAVIKTGGKQYRVTEGQQLQVERLGVTEGEVSLTPVLLVDGDTVVAAPDALAKALGRRPT
jgi:hypothetical protein